MKTLKAGQKEHRIPINLKANHLSEYTTTLTESNPIKTMSLFSQYKSTVNPLPNKEPKQKYNSLEHQRSPLHRYKDSMGTQSTKTNIIRNRNPIDPKINKQINLIVHQVEKSGKYQKLQHRKNNSTTIPKPNQIAKPKLRLTQLNHLTPNKSKSKAKKKKRNKTIDFVNKHMQNSFENKAKHVLVTPVQKMPLIQTPMQMNNKVIRDFSLQSREVNQDIEYSKKNMELTKIFLERRKSDLKYNTRNVISVFDKLKVKSMQNNSIDDVDLDMNIFEEFNQKRTRDAYNRKMKEKETKIDERMNDNASKYADLVLQVNSKKYMNSKPNTEGISEVKIDYNNLRKKITLYKFKSTLLDIENENEILDTVEKFKERKKETDVQLLLALRELGPPNFVKKKFNSKTIKKFNGITGIYLGQPG